MSTQADVYIHAASPAVFRAFSDITRWRDWYPGVLGARWVDGEPWDENARFAIETRNVLGATTAGEAIVRMSVLDDLLVWENNVPGLSVVATARFEDEVGGCKLTLRKTYHGPLAVGMTLLGARQRRMLTEGLGRLKQRVEGMPRGR